MLKFSLLDRASKLPGESDAQALHAVAAHARHAEELGYHRFLVAEHHAVPGLPSGQPALLSSFVAQATSTIRVGTAGIMLPTYAPFLVAEQALTLAALYGRVDIGIGSSRGFTAPVRAALRQAAEGDYPADLRELAAFLAGDAPVTARPQGSRPGMFILAGPGSAVLAAELGWGIIVGGPVAVQERAVRAYRSAGGDGQVISALNIVVASDAAAARALLLPEAYAQAVARSTGIFAPLEPHPDVAALTEQQARRMNTILDNHVYGTPEDVGETLRGIAQRLGVEEFLVTGDMPDRAGRAASEAMLREKFS